MSAWFESNATETHVKLAKAFGEKLFGDRLLTFSPEHIKNIEIEVDSNFKIFGQAAQIMYIYPATIYYGEIIRRAIGGEWIDINDFGGTTGLYYIRYGTFLINPSSEIFWMVEYEWKNHLQKFFKNVIKEISIVKELEQKGSSFVESKILFNCIFPDWYLDYIVDFRGYELQENKRNLIYLNLSVSELNKAHMK